MFDSWTKGSTHYVALFGGFNGMVKLVDKGVEMNTYMPQIALLALSTLETMEEFINGEDDNSKTNKPKEKATLFSAKVHVNFFKQTLLHCNKGLDWAVAHIADNCSVNLKISQLTDIPHIGCCNHKLNLECKRMVTNTACVSFA